MMLVAKPKEIARVTLMAVPTAVGTWTDMPAAETLFMGSANSIQAIDLRGKQECRLLLVRKATSGAASAEVYLEYFTSYSTTVGDYLSIGIAAVTVDITATNTGTETAWTRLVSGARIASAYIAALGINGDGGLDPQFGYLVAEFR